MIKDDLIALKEKREFLQKSAEVMRQAKEEFAAHNKTLIDQISKASVEESALINKIKSEAVNIYKIDEDESKDIGYGVKIQIKKIFDIDKDIAFGYAKEHGICLSLDVGAIKKLATIQDVSGVVITEKPTATIPGKIEIGEDEL